MPRWDPTTYLSFADERGRPFVDLVARVPGNPATIVDLGCGPGHLTPVLRARWPAAQITGMDSSSAMIARAEAEAEADPDVCYVVADIETWRPPQPVDLIASNAAFQWVPTQLEVIPALLEHVTRGGTLAFQVPDNFAGPSHTLLAGLGADPRFARHTEDIATARGVSAETYLELFQRPGWSLDVWRTTYLHVLPGDDPVFAWISGTGARSYLQALPDDLRSTFETEYKAALREAYPRRDYGTVLPFDRVFVVATREVAA